MKTRTVGGSMPDTYFDLVREFPLTSIRDGKHLARAAKFMDKLLQRELDAGGEDYLDALSDLVLRYESENVAIPDASPQDVLRELIRASGLSQQQLADAVGITQSTISAVLRGGRKLTVDHIGKLASYFHVSPAAFLPR
jgi:HTH-type transcriptional regulator / antitoxin HigA